jgi:hypothetical protein
MTVSNLTTQHIDFNEMITNQQRAEELLKVLGNSQSHNPAWALKEVLEKLRKQLSGTNKIDFTDELDVMFNAGWDECLKEIDAICDELELL